MYAGNPSYGTTISFPYLPLSVSLTSLSVTQPGIGKNPVAYMEFSYFLKQLA
jgi:hypothetical protein